MNDTIQDRERQMAHLECDQEISRLRLQVAQQAVTISQLRSQLGSVQDYALRIGQHTLAALASIPKERP